MKEASPDQECLWSLRITNPHDDKERIQDTSGGFLKESYRWILKNRKFKKWRNSQGASLLLIHGGPGKGKTMLLCGIIDELIRQDSSTVAFFFCQATDQRINHASAVLRGLIYLLIDRQPFLLRYVRNEFDKARKDLFQDTNAWSALSRIFKNILNDPRLQDIYFKLVIDALDECITGLPSLLNLLAQESSSHPHVKWIVSSRDRPEITDRLVATAKSCISLELNMESVSDAVERYIQHKVCKLARIKGSRYSDQTRDHIQRYLSSNSEGTFLWVALVCQALDEKSDKWNVLQRMKEFPSGLDAL